MLRRIASTVLPTRWGVFRILGFEQTTGNGDQFSGHGAIEIRPPEFRRALKRPILVQDDALVHEGSPWQKVREADVRTTVFGEIHHWRTHVLR